MHSSQIVGAQVVCRVVVAAILATLPRSFPAATERQQQSAAHFLTIAGLPSVQVLGVRFGSQSSDGRVIIDLEAGVPYTVGRLSQPQRLYIDLFGTRIGPELKDRQMVVDHAVVSRVRVAMNRDSVTRVVFDLHSSASHVIAMLTNPPRLLVEFKGPSATTGALELTQKRTAVLKGASGISSRAASTAKNVPANGSLEMAKAESHYWSTVTSPAAPAPGPIPYGNGGMPGLNYAGNVPPRNVLLIDFGAGTNYDDDILGNNQQRTGDVGFLFGPGISFRRQGKQFTIAFSYQPHFRLYRKTSARNALDQGLQFDANYRVDSRLALQVRGSLLYTRGIFQPNSNEEFLPVLGSPSSLNETLFAPLVRQFEHNLRFDADYQLNGRTSFGLFMGLMEREFNDRSQGNRALRNAEKRNGGLSYRYRLSPHSTLGVNYILQDLRFGPDTRALAHSAFVAYAWQLSPTVTLNLFGGPEYTRLHDVVAVPFLFFTIHVPVFRPRWQWAVGGDLTKRTEKTVFQITAQRQVSDGGGLLGPVVSSFAAVSIRRRLPARWDALWSTGYARNNTLGSELFGGRIESQTASFALERSMTEKLSVRMGYGFVRQRSRQQGLLLANFDRDFWYISLFYRLNPIALAR